MKTVNDILNEHFPPRWNNEGLKERVLEFGDACYKAATDRAIEIMRQEGLGPMITARILRELSE